MPSPSSRYARLAGTQAAKAESISLRVGRGIASSYKRQAKTFALAASVGS
jgi:hypothetical protein